MYHNGYIGKGYTIWRFQVTRYRDASTSYLMLGQRNEILPQDSIAEMQITIIYAIKASKTVLVLFRASRKHCSCIIILLLISLLDSPTPCSLHSTNCSVPQPKIYIFDLISANNAFNLSISVFCCGQLIPIPSSAFGFGIYCTHHQLLRVPPCPQVQEQEVVAYHVEMNMINFLMCDPSVVLQDVVVYCSCCCD